MEPIRRGYVDGRVGQLHYAEAGRGRPVLFLHQTPRSWDEFREVLPVVGRTHRAIAMDMVGFADSDPPGGELTIEACADGAIDLLCALEIPRASVVGHHTGGVVAVDVAARRPDLVDRLILSSTTLVDARIRERLVGRPPIDEVEPRADGSHLLELWRRRSDFYPPKRPDLLQRYVLDALKVFDRVEDGHHAAHRYVMEEAVGRIAAPTMLLVGTEDPFVFGRHHSLAAAIPDCVVRELVGGMVPMVDQMPSEFAEAVLDFLRVD